MSAEYSSPTPDEIRAVLKQFGLTQNDLAEITEVGISTAKQWVARPDAVRQSKMLPGLFALLCLRAPHWRKNHEASEMSGIAKIICDQSDNHPLQ